MSCSLSFVYNISSQTEDTIDDPSEHSVDEFVFARLNAGDEHLVEMRLKSESASIRVSSCI